ncbi:MAG: accessory factor UbiK family protein [Candidatus Halichondribacter symbioticus]
MANSKKLFDDLSSVMVNAMGVAQGARAEAEVAFKVWLERWLAEGDFVTREEFDAVSAMAAKARADNKALMARVKALESKIND